MKQSIGCIYMIKNIKNNKVYIGQTTNINRRIRDHKKMLANNIHTNKNLQEDYNKYNISDFEFCILENNVAKIDLLQKEKYWIDYYGGIESSNTYNMTTYQHLNYQVKSSISSSNTGKIRSQEFKDKLSYMKNKLYECDQEVKHKISETLKEYYTTDEGLANRRKRSEEGKVRYKGANNPMYGKKHTEDSKLQMSEHKKGSIPWNKGKVGLYKTSAETKEKQRLASTKYDSDFIKLLRAEYVQLKTYKAVAQKYNLNICCVSRLIRYGSTKIPTKICND